MLVLVTCTRTRTVISYSWRALTGPINREMRNLITSLKNHNEQLKGEIQRYKKKLKDSLAEAARVSAWAILN